MSPAAPPHLWQFSATELFKAYERGETTPKEVLEATLERLKQVNSRLNAVVTLDADGARVAAIASTKRWRAKQTRGPIDGVPITIKDSLFVGGLRTTWGSRIFADYVPPLDELPVARLRESGAIILGKTNVPEFTVQGYTDNLIFGPTRNPWNAKLTPGGSSGGAVAAVAAGIGPIAFGTDGGGSIRRPASHTGLVGFKPSRGAVPRTGGFPAILLDFEVVGAMARCMDDIITAMRIIGTPGVTPPSSATSAPPPCRILYAPTFADAPVDAEIAASVGAAAAELERQGHHIEQFVRFDLAEPLDNIWPIVSQTGVAWLLSQYHGWKGKVGPAVAAMGCSVSRRARRSCQTSPRRRRLIRALRSHSHADHCGASLASHREPPINDCRTAGWASRPCNLHSVSKCCRVARNKFALCAICERAADRLPIDRRSGSGCPCSLGLSRIREHSRPPRQVAGNRIIHQLVLIFEEF
jgi:aspartyl-tRNA(Asn)/glutamyl-tRNA(Gln) amidotransferase subunit A